ncbi:MAG: tetratricopeptide repeat protein [Bdellovibrionia bacterium]
MSELTKEQLKGPDRFQKFSKSLIEWVRKNQNVVGGLGALAIVGGIAYSGYDFYRTRIEERARLALYEAQKIKQSFDDKEQDKKTKEEEAKKPADKKDDKTKQAKKEEKKDEKPPATQEELNKLKTDALQAFEKVIGEFPGTAAAHIAVLQSSQIFLDDKKLDEAKQVFDKAKEPSSRQGILLGAFLNQKGKVLAEKGDCEGAVREWEKVYSNSSLSVWHGDSLVKAGICYEKLSKKDKAIELYKKASSDETDAGRAAKKFLILAERPQPKG